MAPKILVVLTSHDRIDAVDKPTGWYLVSGPGASSSSPRH